MRKLSSSEMMVVKVLAVINVDNTGVREIEQFFHSAEEYESYKANPFVISSKVVEIAIFNLETLDGYNAFMEYKGM